MPADPNRVILTGENPFIRLSHTDGGPNTTNASFWRIITCPAGPGHVLYLNSELTQNRWRIYSDNIAMARWLQSTVQGMLNAETADTAADPLAGDLLNMFQTTKIEAEDLSAILELAGDVEIDDLLWMRVIMAVKQQELHVAGMFREQRKVHAVAVGNRAERMRPALLNDVGLEPGWHATWLRPVQLSRSQPGRPC